MAPPGDPELQLGLDGGREYLANLHKALGALRGRGENDTPEFKQIAGIAAEVSALVGQAWMTLNQAHIVPPDAVSNQIRAGRLQEAARAVAEKVEDSIGLLRQGAADLVTLRRLKPVTLPSGTNLAAAASNLAWAGSPASDPAERFLAAHPAARKLTATQRLRGPIAAGDDGAKAHLAMLTAIVEYGDKLAAPLPDMRVRPPADSPFLAVYDKMKRLLEGFQFGGTKINLLNPGRLSSLMQTDRAAGLKAVELTLQTQPALRKDALKVATELREAFETAMNSIFATSIPEVGALRQAIADLCTATGVAFADRKANLLLNPHLDPAVCIAELGALIEQDPPAAGAEPCLALALRLRGQVNLFIQQTLQQQAAALYQELDGAAAGFAVASLSAGNMADATGLPLTSGNASGAPDYVALLNNGYGGRLELAGERPFFVSDSVDAQGLPLYTARVEGEVGRDMETALFLQPLKLDTARHFEHPPTVTVTIPAGEAEPEQVVIHYHRQGRGFRPELAGQPLPAGMAFDAERSVLSLGPRYCAGQFYRVELAVRTQEAFGDWEDFVIIVATATSPWQSVVAAGGWAPGSWTRLPGLELVPAGLARVVAGWLARGAGLEFTELVGSGINPASPAAADGDAQNCTRLDLRCRIDREGARAGVRVAIHSYTEPRPAPAYQGLAAHDPGGHVGLSQDRSVATGLALLAALQQELTGAGRADLAAGLQPLTGELQMLVLNPPG